MANLLITTQTEQKEVKKKNLYDLKTKRIAYVKEHKILREDVMRELAQLGLPEETINAVLFSVLHSIMEYRITEQASEQKSSTLELEEMRQRSQKRADELREQLGLSDDPSKINGFKEIGGILKPYAKSTEDSVDILASSREEEKDNN